MTAELDRQDIREFTNALKDLTVEVRINTVQTKNQTEYFKNNGFANLIVNKLTRRFSVILGLVVSITGIIILFVKGV